VKRSRGARRGSPQAARRSAPDNFEALGCPAGARLDLQHARHLRRLLRSAASAGPGSMAGQPAGGEAPQAPAGLRRQLRLPQRAAPRASARAGITGARAPPSGPRNHAARRQRVRAPARAAPGGRRAGACPPAWRAAARSAPRRARGVSRGHAAHCARRAATPSLQARARLRLSQLACARQSTGPATARAQLNCRLRLAALRAWPAPAAKGGPRNGKQRRTSSSPRLRLAGPLLLAPAAPSALPASSSARPGSGGAALMASRAKTAARASSTCAGPALRVRRQRGARRMPQSTASCCLDLGAGAHHARQGVRRGDLRCEELALGSARRAPPPLGHRAEQKSSAGAAGLGSKQAVRPAERNRELSCVPYSAGFERLTLQAPYRVHPTRSLQGETLEASAVRKYERRQAVRETALPEGPPVSHPCQQTSWCSPVAQCRPACGACSALPSGSSLLQSWLRRRARRMRRLRPARLTPEQTLCAPAPRSRQQDATLCGMRRAPRCLLTTSAGPAQVADVNDAALALVAMKAAPSQPGLADLLARIAKGAAAGGSSGPAKRKRGGVEVRRCLPMHAPL